MSMNHTLEARLRDMKIELELWFVAWIVMSAILATSIYLYLQPVTEASLWRDYVLARILDFIGLGSVAIPGWHMPDLVIQFVKEHLPSEILANWDRDFVLILGSPAYAIVVLASAFLIFFDRKA